MKKRVYALRDPRDGRVRYVGHSVSPSARLHSHVTRPHSAPMRAWVDELRAVGKRPRLRILRGGTERSWMQRLAPDLNIVMGSDLDDPSRPIVIPVSRELKALFWEAARRARQTIGQWVMSACVEQAERQGVAVVDPVSKKKGGR